jgi:uncharacterized protein (TIGR03083 family)
MREREALYEESRAAIVGVIAEAAAVGIDAAAPVPACPAWSVHDVIAHLAGSCADVLVGNITGVATEPWTSAQVDARRGVSFQELVAEWDVLAPQFATLIDDFPGRYPDQTIADVAVHEHDIRGALGRPGRRQSDAVERSLDLLLTTIVHAGARGLGLPPLQVRADGRSWVVGTGEPALGEPGDVIRQTVLAGEPPAPPQTQPVGTLSAPPFELFRAVTGRRSAAQIRRFDWTVDPDGHLALFSAWPFTARTEDLFE